MANKEQMLAAMSSALDTGGTPPVETPAPPTGEEPVVTPPEVVAPAGETPPAEGEPPAGETPPEGEETPVEGEEEKEKEGEESAGGKPGEKKPEAPAKPDHLNDPVPKDLHERTRERITSLVGMVKDRDTRITEQNYLFEQVAATGVSAENFSQTLTVLRLYNSENIEEKRLAYKFLLQQAQELAPQIGETLPGDDPLAGHQDLIDAVGANSITQEYAEEIARTRSRTTAQKTAGDEAGRRAQAEQQYETAKVQAIAELNALHEALKAEPGFAAKYKILVPALKPVMAKLHPSQWKATFEAAYRQLKIDVAPAGAGGVTTPTGTPAGKTTQPLRANKQPPGQGNAQPKSALEAMSAALDGMKG